MYIGNFKNNPCFVSKSAPNTSVCITGISGSGKTVRMQKIELEYVRRGGTVLVLDTNQTHTRMQIFSEIENEYEWFTNRIEALQDGVNLSLLTPIAINGECESIVMLANAIVNVLTAGQTFGIQQIGVLRTAVLEAIQNRQKFQTDVEAIAYFLLSADNPRANDVYQRLWTVLNCGVLRPGSRNIVSGKINIIDISSLDQLSKNVISELFLSVVWRNIVHTNLRENMGGVLLCLDEFQNLSWKKEAVMRDILREGRKFGISLALATQSLSVFPRDVVALLNQTATRLIFQPAINEIKPLAKGIDFSQPKKWMEELGCLQVGECLAIGNLLVGNQMVNHPIRLN